MFEYLSFLPLSFSEISRNLHKIPFTPHLNSVPSKFPIAKPSSFCKHSLGSLTSHYPEPLLTPLQINSFGLDFFYVSVCLPTTICLSIYLCSYLSIIYLCAYLYIYLSIIYPCIHASIQPSTYLSLFYPVGYLISITHFLISLPCIF